MEHLTREELDKENIYTALGQKETPLTLTETETENDIIRAKSNYHILVVDDEDEMLHFITAELCPYFIIDTCKDGKDALNKLLTQKYDLVVSDVMMPVMDGIELCKLIKKNININFIPVILLTAKTSEEDRIEGIETGADAYIAKPFSTDLLMKTICNLIDNRRRVTSNLENKEKIDEKINNVDIATSDEQLMQRVLKVVNANISNSDFNVEMLAQEVGISRVHFYRRLKELTNMSPHYFIKTIRLKQAAQLLLKKNVNVSDAAYATGFSNLARFSNDFKIFFGESPKEYAKNHKEE
jgi:DNA-binding response OmpR family regulator